MAACSVFSGWFVCLVVVVFFCDHWWVFLIEIFQVEAQVPVFTLTKDIGIPGLSLYTDFISPEDEQVCMYRTYNLLRVLGPPLLVTRSVDKWLWKVFCTGTDLLCAGTVDCSGCWAVDNSCKEEGATLWVRVFVQGPSSPLLAVELWHFPLLSIVEFGLLRFMKRMISKEVRWPSSSLLFCWYFLQTRNVDKNQKLGVLPLSVEPVLSKVALLSEMTHAKEPSLPLDQLTVWDLLWF